MAFGQSTTDPAPGSDCTSQASGSSLCNPIQVKTPKGQWVNDVPAFLKYTLGYVGGLLGFIAVITVVYAGIRMITANGNEKQVSEAKQAITYAVTGFVLAVMAYAGIAAIENLIGVQKTSTPGGGLFNPFATNDLKELVKNTLQNVMGLSGLLAIGVLIWNGFRYITSRGDEHAVSAAKKGIYWGLIGLVIIIFAYVIIAATAKLLTP